VDVAATLLSLAGVEARLGGGSDLLAPPRAAHPTLGMRRTYDRPLEALRTDGSSERFEGYLFYAVDGSGAIRVGNGEAVEGGRPSEARGLASLFQRFERQLGGLPAAAPLDAETERALRALGYVN
jgi:hypothetical protein